MSQSKSEALEAGINKSRESLQRTMEALETRVSPSELFSKAMNYTRENGGDFGHNLVQTVKSNPVPVMVAAAGLAWLAVAAGQSQNQTQKSSGGMRGRVQHDGFTDSVRGDHDTLHTGLQTRSTQSDHDALAPFAAKHEQQSVESEHASIGEKAKAKAQSAMDAASDQLGSASERLHDTRDHASDTAHSFYDSAGDRMSSMKQNTADKTRHVQDKMRRNADQLSQRAGEQWERGQREAKQLWHEHPLAVGAAGVAIGALLGALVPRTEQENRLMGRTSDNLKHSLQEKADDQVEALREEGSNTMQKAIRNASETVQAVADDAAEKVQGEIKQRGRPGDSASSSAAVSKQATGRKSSESRFEPA